MQRTLYLSALLVVALAFSAWLIQEINSDATSTAHNLSDTPDSFMLKAIYTRTNEQGNLENQIYASKMTHYSQDDVSKFTDPQIIIFTQDRKPWNITAQQGVSLHGITQVTLQNNVKVHQSAGPNNQELTLTTSSLTIFPQQQTAQTDQPVKIIQPGTVINSVGLKADMKKGEVDLLSKARGVYETTTSP